MAPRFEYLERRHCVCGESLPDSGRVVRTASPWGEVRFVRCPRCGSWCQRPQVSPASLGAWYDSDDYQGSARHRGSAYANYLADEPSRVAEAWRRYRRDLAPHLPPLGGRVLEVGCATGSLLAAVRQAGHDVAGVDLSRRFAVAARTLHGLDVQVGEFLDVNLPPAWFDVVVLLGTISNLPDLPAALSRARTLMRPPGTLVVNFPAADSLVARAYGRRFWMFAPSVSTFLSTSGCQIAIAAAGFTNVRVRADWQMPSLSKLMQHARLGALAPIVEHAGLGAAAIPVPMPLPGIRLATATAP